MTASAFFGEWRRIPPQLDEMGLVAALTSDPRVQANLPLTHLWSRLVNTDNPAVAATDLAYTCESGTGTRRNKQKQMADLQFLMQTMLPVAGSLLSSGATAPWNKLMRVIAEFGDLPLKNLIIDPSELAGVQQGPPNAPP